MGPLTMFRRIKSILETIVTLRDVVLSHTIIHISSRTPLDISLFIFAEEGKRRSRNVMMLQMVDRPNATPTGQDRETLTFK